MAPALSKLDCSICNLFCCSNHNWFFYMFAPKRSSLFCCSIGDEVKKLVLFTTNTLAYFATMKNFSLGLHQNDLAYFARAFMRMTQKHPSLFCCTSTMNNSLTPKRSSLICSSIKINDLSRFTPKQSSLFCSRANEPNLTN